MKKKIAFCVCRDLREGLFARPAASSDEIQLRIDPMHGDLDEEISGLYGKVRQLKGVRFPPIFLPLYFISYLSIFTIAIQLLELESRSIGEKRIKMMVFV